MPDQREVVYFTAVETKTPKPTPIIDQEPELTKTQRDTYDPIIEGFLENYPNLIGRPDIRPQLEQLETVFVTSGRYLELYEIYNEDYKKRGLDSHTVERLAWGHVRLGQQKAARDLIDELIKRNPSDPVPHFLSGAYYLQWDPTSDKSLKGIVESWGRLLELAPNYRGFEGITARDIRTQLDRAKRILEQRGVKEEPNGLSALELARERVGKAPAMALATIEAAMKPVEEPQVVESEKEPEPPQEQPEQPKTNKEQEYKLAVARGEILLAEGKAREAENAFLAAKSIKPDGFGAEFGQLRAGWTIETQRPKVARRIRTLAQREDLTAHQYYDLGLFAYSRMDDKDLSGTLFAKTKSMDPELAKRLGIDKLK